MRRAHLHQPVRAHLSSPNPTSQAPWTHEQPHVGKGTDRGRLGTTRGARQLQTGTAKQTPRPQTANRVLPCGTAQTPRLQDRPQRTPWAVHVSMDSACGTLHTGPRLTTVLQGFVRSCSTPQVLTMTQYRPQWPPKGSPQRAAVPATPAKGSGGRWAASTAAYPPTHQDRWKAKERGV